MSTKMSKERQHSSISQDSNLPLLCTGAYECKSAGIFVQCVCAVGCHRLQSSGSIWRACILLKYDSTTAMTAACSACAATTNSHIEQGQRDVAVLLAHTRHKAKPLQCSLACPSSASGGMALVMSGTCQAAHERKLDCEGRATN